MYSTRALLIRYSRQNSHVIAQPGKNLKVSLTAVRNWTARCEDVICNFDVLISGIGEFLELSVQDMEFSREIF